MSKNKAIEYLERYKKATQLIRRCEEELEIENQLIDTVRSASDIDGMPRGSEVSNPTEVKAIRLVDKRNRLKEAIIEAVQVQQDIFDTIMEIGGIEADVLIERYINLKTWTEVCESVNYSWYPVRQAWHRGIDMIDEILRERDKQHI